VRLEKSSVTIFLLKSGETCEGYTCPHILTDVEFYLSLSQGSVLEDVLLLQILELLCWPALRSVPGICSICSHMVFTICILLLEHECNASTCVLLSFCLVCTLKADLLGCLYFKVVVWQGIVAEINHAIGATGVISGECKLVVEQYADIIIQLLMSQVNLVMTFT
jgi:hypothetical protein